MTNNYITTDYYRTKFYQSENDFKKFLNLSEEQLSTIAKKVYKEQELIKSSNTPYHIQNIPKSDKYHKALQFITKPLIHYDFPTFDERVAVLIMMTDPNLVIFKEFLKINLISIKDITSEEDEEERNRLKNIRNKTLSKYESAVREKIGFFDIRLLKYEELFFKKFFGEKELITEVNKNNQDGLINQSKLLKNFNSISDKRYKELIDIAKTWLSLAPTKYNITIAAYSITTQYKLLGLNNITEQLALFILLIDSNLDMLRIYEEESMIPNVKARITEEFGYFNQDLLILERKFHDRFCPDKQLSIWTRIKKH